MRKQVVVVSLIAAALLGTGARVSHAATPAPGGGPAFGRHVASMAPEHPRKGGAEFGGCVSTMARGIDCPDAP